MKTIKKRSFVTLVAFLIGLGAFAQEITGTWKGTLSVQGTEMPLVFNISDEAGTLSATMDSPSQGYIDHCLQTSGYQICRHHGCR